MKAEIEEIPETLHAAIQFFSTGDNALKIMVSRRWPNGVDCPHCQSKEVTFMASVQRWQCKAKACRKQFTVKVGTIFEDSPIKLDKWLSAFWMITNAKNGISSCELHRAIGVTQKTAWFMLHRIRLGERLSSLNPMGHIIWRYIVLSAITQQIQCIMNYHSLAPCIVGGLVIFQDANSKK